MGKKEGTLDIVTTFATVGAILIGLGVAWIFISNWHEFSRFTKIFILLGATSASFYAAYTLEQKSYGKTAQSVYLLTTLLWTLSIFIIAQQFNYGISWQENTHLFLIGTIGALTIAYSVASTPSLYLGVVMFSLWAYAQAWVYGLDWAYDYSSGYTYSGFSSSLVVFGLALFYFGLGLYHRAQNSRDFAKIYTWAATMLVLFMGLWFTFQSAQTILAIPFQSLLSGQSIFFIIIPLAVAGLGIYSVLGQKKLHPFDAYSGPFVWLVYVFSATTLPLFLGTSININMPGDWLYGTPIWEMGAPFLLQWLYFNVIYVLLILFIIDFAAREQRDELMHIALNFFGVYIVIRYIGFMMDLQGYLALSLLLIIGGLLLIGLSLGYHKFRKYTLEKAT